MQGLTTQFPTSHLAQQTGLQSILVYVRSNYELFSHLFDLRQSQLASRDEARGRLALEEVQKVAPLNATVRLVPLDIASSASIGSFAHNLAAEHGTIDILVNNAGMAARGSGVNVDDTRATIACNYEGTKEVRYNYGFACFWALNVHNQMCNVFLPLLNPEHGHLVNISSMMGRLSQVRNAELTQRWRSASTRSNVDALLHEFVGAVADGKHKIRGWPDNSYAVSKIGVTALTRVLALENDRPGVLINSCCPGWVQTDMTRNKGTKTPEQGAQTPVHLALADLGGRSGEFWEDQRVSQW